MNFNFWGFIIVIVGLFMFFSGLTKSKNLIYRLLVARSKILWKTEEVVHKFYLVIGILVILFGILVALEIIKK
jgi:uncharacterized membrane protein